MLTLGESDRLVVRNVARRESGLVHEHVLGPLFAAAMLFAAFLPDFVPRPPCVFRALTDIPCMTCGSTRAAFALARLDPVEALAMNPLMTFVLVGVGVYVLHAAAVFAGVSRSWSLTWSSKTRWAGRILLALIAVNWAYLVAVGR